MKSKNAASDEEFTPPEECRDVFAVIDERLSKIEDALFHEERGLHTVAKRLILYADLICVIVDYTARGMKLITAAIVGLAALVGAAKVLGVV